MATKAVTLKEKINPNALVEVVKFVTRMVILGSPIIIAFLTDVQEKGWLGALAVLLVTADKYIHENGRIPVNGLVPF